MRVIHRAATCAYSFVAMNWEQVTALAHLARGGDQSARWSRDSAAPASRAVGGSDRPDEFEFRARAVKTQAKGNA
jgi:hypothetical protein